MRLPSNLQEVEQALIADVWDPQKADSTTSDAEWTELIKGREFIVGIDEAVSPYDEKAVIYVDAQKVASIFATLGEDGLTDETEYIVGQRSLADHVSAFAELVGVDLSDRENQFCVRAVANSLANRYYRGRFTKNKVWDYYPEALEEAKV